jgi:chorismate mutase-like protein
MRRQPTTPDGDKRDDDALLERHRAAIDALDRELLRLLSERAAHARSIGALKTGEAYRPEREAQVLRGVREDNPGPLSDEAIAGIFRQIMSACLALEQRLSVAYPVPRERSATALSRATSGSS